MVDGEHLLTGGGAGFTARLERWVADARIDEAALSRAREHWLRDVAEQEATFAGVLLDLAERRAPARLELGDRHRNGTIQALGVDFVALAVAAGADVLVAIDAIDVVRTTRGLDPALGDRMLVTELRLASVLTELVADRERVRLVTRSGAVVTGALRSVGHDLVVLRGDGHGDGTAYVPLRAIAEVAIS